jgi:hypothetical protein
VLAAAAAELAELQPLGRRLLILRRRVIPTLAFRALKHNVIARHNSNPLLKLIGAHGSAGAQATR